MSFADLPKPSWPELLYFVEKLLQSPRYADAKALANYGRKVYSQNDEDGILQEIFRRIGVENRSFLEFGVEGGVECNSLWLLIQGWSGVWLEGNPDHVTRMMSSHAHWINEGRLNVIETFVNAENINNIITEAGLSGDIDFMSIDIDGNDYWVWQAIDCIKPRVVCTEYNATWPPPVSLTIKYYKDMIWSGSNHFGASLTAMADLGSRKGYHLVGCNLSGANAFFVRKDLCKDLFLDPGSVETHYEPARYFLADLPSGHPAGVAETIMLPRNGE